MLIGSNISFPDSGFVAWMILGGSLKIIQLSDWRILSLWPPCLRLWAQGFGLDSCFIQRGGLKICGVPLTAQGKDIQVSPKVLLPFTHSLHHKVYKNPELLRRKAGGKGRNPRLKIRWTLGPGLARERRQHLFYRLLRGVKESFQCFSLGEGLINSVQSPDNLLDIGFIMLKKFWPSSQEWWLANLLHGLRLWVSGTKIQEMMIIPRTLNWNKRVKDDEWMMNYVY